MKLLRHIHLLVFTLLFVLQAEGQTKVDSVSSKHRFIHRPELLIRGGYIIPTHENLKGASINLQQPGSNVKQFNPIRSVTSFHLRYAFELLPGTSAARAFINAYQGIGLGYFYFPQGNQQLVAQDKTHHFSLGHPIALYLFQGGRLARLNHNLSLHYEWQFGISFGWKGYHKKNNEYNKMLGGSINAYLHAGVNIQYRLTPNILLKAGINASHFSNANTNNPNAGLNMTEGEVGVIYQINPEKSEKENTLAALPAFHRHISYDLLCFGGWREKPLIVNNKKKIAPGKYGVAGISFAPMYNLGYKYRIGLAVDAIYDHSSGITGEQLTEDHNGTTPEYAYYIPNTFQQMALGLSLRGELVMPFFTICAGIGANVLHGNNDLKGLYQLLALKIALSKSSYLNIGYSLRNFHEPNHLMLGIGYRFNNRRTKL